MTTLKTIPQSSPKPPQATGSPNVSEVSRVPAGRRRRLFTRADCYRMAEAGILSGSEKLELIDAEIVVKNPQGPRHGGGVTGFQDLVYERLAGQILLRTQLPIVLSDLSEPEPDFAIVHRRDDMYRSCHPTVAEIHFLVEVMDTPGHTDRRAKLPLYARHAVPEVWLIDLARRWIEVYREPHNGEYTQRRTVHDGALSPMAFPKAAFPVSEILGPPRETDEEDSNEPPTTDH